MQDEIIKKDLIDLASENQRFENVFTRAIGKLSMEDQNKYKNQFAYFKKKINRLLEDFNIKVVDLYGEIYDPGMSVTPINIDEFETGDILQIIQTIEPIVLMEDKVVKMGTVVLGRKEG